MTRQTYLAGHHAYLFPASAEILENDADWQQGYNDARELAQQVRSKPTFTAHLTDEGMIDMFVIGADGIPVARKGHMENGVFIPEPTWTGEEALPQARAWLEAQAEEIEEELEDVEQTPAV
jgi:hypothetical protein